MDKTFTNSLKDYIEAWFDYHPEPENLELFEIPKTITGSETTITVFAADQVLDTYMIKLCFPTAKRAYEAEQYLGTLADLMNVTMILLNRKLFIFTDRRF